MIRCEIMQGEIHHVLNPNPYRGVFGSDAKRYAEDVQDHIDHGTSGKVAGFIAETIQVCLRFLTANVFLNIEVSFMPRCSNLILGCLLTTGSWGSSRISPWILEISL